MRVHPWPADQAVALRLTAHRHTPTPKGAYLRRHRSPLLCTLVAVTALAVLAPMVQAQPRNATRDPLARTALRQIRLIAPNGAALGFSVAISGNTALVGGSQKAFVFVRSGSRWTLQQRLTPQGAGWSSASFGASVALAGDTAVVGAPRKAAGGYGMHGGACVFTRSGSTWTLQQQLTTADEVRFGQFGTSVAVVGDTALVGAPTEKVDGKAVPGAVYVFTRSGVTWTLQQRLAAADGVAGDRFGFAVALSGDTALIGAPKQKLGTPAKQGAAYAFTRVEATWSQEERFIAKRGADNDLFGISVSLSGDTALIGAEGRTVGTYRKQGSAFVFFRGAAGWALQKQLTAADTGSYLSFGAPSRSWATAPSLVPVARAAGPKALLTCSRDAAPRGASNSDLLRLSPSSSRSSATPLRSPMTPSWSGSPAAAPTCSRATEAGVRSN